MPPSRSVRGRERAKRCERGMPGVDGWKGSQTIRSYFDDQQSIPLTPLTLKRRGRDSSLRSK